MHKKLTNREKLQNWIYFWAVFFVSSFAYLAWNRWLFLAGLIAYYGGLVVAELERMLKHTHD